MNKVVLLGRLTRDAEIRYTQNQMAVASFFLAVPRIKNDEADFIPCTAFGKTAEIKEKYVKKGNRILIDGRWYTSSYTDSEGKKRYTSSCIVDRIEFIEKKSDEPKAEPDEGFMAVADGLEDEGLPF